MLLFVGANSGINGDVLTSTRYIPFTPANAGNQVGLVLQLYSTTTSLVIKLQEQTSPGVWTDRTTDNFSPTVVGAKFQIHYFALTTYAITAAAATWRYAVSAAAGTLCRSATAADYLFAAVMDASAAGPSSTDCIVLADNTTLTLDQTFTFNPVTTGGAAITLCEGSTFQWENPPAAAYTLTLGGHILHSYTTAFSIGSQALPIPYTERATLALTNNTSIHHYCWGPSGLKYTQNGTHNVWGAEDTHFISRITADAAAGQKVLITADDMSSYWAANDYVAPFGEDVAGYSVTEYQIDTVVGTTVTLKTNLTNKILAGGALTNRTRADRTLGIKTGGNIGAHEYFTTTVLLNSFNLVGVEMIDMRVLNGATVAGTGATSIIRCLYFRPITAVATTAIVVTVSAGNTYSATIKDIVIHSTSNSTGAISTLTGIGLTVDNLYIKGNASVTTTLTMSLTSSTISNVVAGNGTGISVLISGSSSTYLNCMFGGSPVGYYALGASCNACTFTGLRIYRGLYGIYVNNSVSNIVVNSFINSQSDAVTDIVYSATGTYNTWIFLNCALGAAGIGNMGAAAAGSYLKFQTYNNTVNDHRSWWSYGIMQSVGTGLTDTTVRTAGGFAIRFEPLSSTSPLTWIFDIPTGNIQAKTMSVGVWCKINNAAYYSGTHQLPRLTVNYDDGTTVYAEALGNTDWQLLMRSFTPATTFGQITVTLSAMTDQTTTNAYVYFDDFMVIYPPNVALDLGALDLWANALPITPPLAIPLSVGSILAAIMNESGVGYTGFLPTNLDAKVSDIPTAGENADAVMDEQATGHTGFIATKLLTLSKFLGLK